MSDASSEPEKDFSRPIRELEVQTKPLIKQKKTKAIKKKVRRAIRGAPQIDFKEYMGKAEERIDSYDKELQETAELTASERRLLPKDTRDRIHKTRNILNAQRNRMANRLKEEDKRCRARGIFSKLKIRPSSFDDICALLFDYKGTPEEFSAAAR